MRKREVLLFLLLGTLMLSGCNKKTEENTIESTIAVSNSITEIDTSNMFSDRDKEVGYEESESVAISLVDDSSVCESDAVVITENTVTIKEEGTYILSGSLSNGMVIVEAEDTDKIQIILNGVSISNSQSAALYVRSADKVFITTASGTENILENNGTYVVIDENNIDSAVFSKSDLTLNGEGTLTVTAQEGHGIVSKDDLVLTSGTYVITSASHGISGKDSVRIANGSYTIVSEKDGIHAENTEDSSLGFVYLAGGSFSITSQQDGISASSWLQAEDGTYEILSGEGSARVQNQSSGEDKPMQRTFQEEAEENTTSIKGIKAVTQLVLNGGTYNIDAEDDALHSNGNLAVKNGTYALSSGDDGIHADSNASISGGGIDIIKSYEGIEGLSIDITGGEIFVLATDDGMNAAGGNDSSGFEGPGFGGDQFASTEGAYINIAGGVLRVNASGDGIDSNGDITVSGGETYVSGPTNDGNGTLDYSGTAQVTEGIFAAAGSSGMAQNFDSSSTQGVIMINTDPQEQNTNIVLLDSNGTELLNWTAEKEYSSIIISSSEIKEGETYTIKAGTTEQSITMDSLVYGNNSHGGAPGSSGGERGDRQGDGMQRKPGKEQDSGNIL
ncbi:carbohydrate-binding domain-containing protein [Coprococcus sp. AF21-14LB]|uniref:carbohydrate-binding domain-containing protein n=1 Tax=Coprococcus sp. AF21-14LB TaxID=2292231 RepID=UPI000E4C91AB|nr:carbohydrate-binding domain-containing protein [Coprococcus sp. AF21-14LB]RGS78857.1 carbohydrate-binding domain-containing protein [Coprococcus sp. AF21-14LB]